jgi:hypothetical protein
MAGDILDQAITKTTLTVTNLHSLASSATWIAGWTSASVDNTTNDYLDYLISGSFTTHASNRQVGSINVYAVGFDTTPTIPAVSSGTLGTEGAVAFADTFRRSSLVRQIVGIEVDATASAIYAFPPTGIRQFFGRELPPYWCLFVAQNASTTTTAGLASSGSALFYTPKHRRYT